MRYLLAILLLANLAFPQQILAPIFQKAPSSAPVTWTFSQVACSGNTGCPAAGILQTGTSAIATFSSALTAGDTVVFGIEDTGATPPSSVKVGTATITGPVTGCQVANATIGAEINCYYFLSAAGGETTATVTFASAPAAWFYVVAVAHKSTSAVFDVAANTNTTSPCTSCATTNASLTGSNDFIFRVYNNQNGGATAITGSYTFVNPLTTDIDRIGAYIVSASSGTGPTVSISSSGQFMDAVLAIK